MVSSNEHETTLAHWMYGVDKWADMKLKVSSELAPHSK